MHSIVWANILAPAGVAAFVTLAIEYVAKPRLDARKERIVDIYRDQHDALKKAKRASLLLGSVQSFVDNYGDNDPHYANLVNENVTESRALLLDAFTTARTPRRYESDWDGLIAIVTAFAIGFDGEEIPSESPTWKRVKCGLDGLEALIELLTTSRLHILRRHSLTGKVRVSLQNTQKKNDAGNVLEGHQQ